MSITVVPDPNKDPIRRLTNQELWNAMLEAPPVPEPPQWPIGEVQRELERRLRKIAFLPALPPKEDA